DGMSLRDLHAPVYVVVGDSLSQAVPAGADVRVPLYASFLTDGKTWGDSLTLRAELYGWDALGQRHVYVQTTRHVPFHPWMTGPLEPLQITVPAGPAVLVLAVRLRNPDRRSGQRGVRSGSLVQGAIRQGPGRQRSDRGRLHAGTRHARPEPEPERVPDDRRAAVSQRRDGAHQRCGRRSGGAGR